MKRALVSVGIAALFAAPAIAQPPPVEAEGKVTVEGIAPEKVLGAIDTRKLVEADATADAEPPKPHTQVTVDTTVQETPTAIVETQVEVIEAAETRPMLDPDNPIAPEVKAVVESKPRYTTADLAMAQLEAIRATPTSTPTTTITTKTTTPKPGQ